MFDVLFPPRCVLCRKPLDINGHNLLCPECEVNVRNYRWELPLYLPGAAGAAAALFYTGDVRSAMQRFKFQHHKKYLYWFASETLPVLRVRLKKWKPDLITYIPISWWREHTRGYNQCEQIARMAGMQYNLVCMGLLQKKPFARRQSRLNAEQRKENAMKAFYLPKWTEQHVKGRRIVVIDDIWTTGATLSAAISLLRHAGASRVYVLTMTKVP